MMPQSFWARQIRLNCCASQRRGRAKNPRRLKETPIGIGTGGNAFRVEESGRVSLLALRVYEPPAGHRPAVRGENGHERSKLQSTPLALLAKAS